MFGLCFSTLWAHSREFVYQWWILSIYCWPPPRDTQRLKKREFSVLRNRRWISPAAHFSKFETPTCLTTKSSRNYMTVFWFRGISDSGVPCLRQLFFLVHFRHVTVIGLPNCKWAVSSQRTPHKLPQLQSDRTTNNEHPIKPSSLCFISANFGDEIWDRESNDGAVSILVVTASVCICFYLLYTI